MMFMLALNLFHDRILSDQPTKLVIAVTLARVNGQISAFKTVSLTETDVQHNNFGYMLSSQYTQINSGLTKVCPFPQHNNLMSGSIVQVVRRRMSTENFQFWRFIKIYSA
jgi:hypothetical protein